jgi:hypothetical protein
MPQEIRPEFGLDKQIEAGLQSIDKPGDDPGEVERRITVVCHTSQPLLYSFPSSLGHRRDYEAVFRMTAMQLVDKRCHPHDFAERDGVNPDDWSILSVWSIRSLWSVWFVWSIWLVRSTR